MKYFFKYSLIILFILSSISTIQAQIKYFGDCNSYQKPMFLHKGDTVISLCDTVVMMNTLRFNLYESARQMVLNNKYSKLQADVNTALNEQVELYKAWNDSLQMKYSTVSTMFANSLNNTQTELNKVSNEIVTAKDSLKKANENLDSALKHIHNAQWEKYKWGGAGLLIGILGTSLIMIAR